MQTVKEIFIAMAIVCIIWMWLYTTCTGDSIVNFTSNVLTILDNIAKSIVEK